MFPEYRDLISKLKQTDAHFARVFDEHNELDDKISGLENNPVTSATADAEVQALKHKKLALKDELYRLLKEAEAKLYTDTMKAAVSSDGTAAFIVD